jgi:hypothetical protein
MMMDKFKSYIDATEFNPLWIFSLFAGPITEEPSNRSKLPVELSNGEIILIKRNSPRYILFKNKGLTCVTCGLTATYAKINVTDPGIGHFNFYARQFNIKTSNVEEVLFTKDHIIPSSCGGKDQQLNYQPMCCHCNCEKGNFFSGESSPKEPEMREYYYGIQNIFQSSTGKYILVPYSRVKRKNTILPDNLVKCWQTYCKPGDIQEIAKKACEEYIWNSVREEVIKNMEEEITTPQPGQVTVGSVATHEDGGRIHWTIVLDLPNDTHAWVLFFSSTPHGRCSRQATKDELALAGFVSTRPTYLNLVYRPVEDFYVRGSFPEHRVEALKKEFEVENANQRYNQYYSHAR